MKTVSLKTLGAIVFVMLISTAAFAQPGNRGGCNKGNGPDIPGLTEEQKQEMKNLRIEHQKEMLPLRNQLGELHAKLRTLSTGDDVNMKEVNKQLEAISSVKLQMAKKRAAHRQGIRKILNEEQRVFFDSHYGKGFHGKKGKHAKGSKGGCGGGGGCAGKKRGRM